MPFCWFCHEAALFFFFFFNPDMMVSPIYFSSYFQTDSMFWGKKATVKRKERIICCMLGAEQTIFRELLKIKEYLICTINFNRAIKTCTCRKLPLLALLSIMHIDKNLICLDKGCHMMKSYFP